MFQDNPLLAQLKEKLHSQTPRVEGLVKSTDKGFGFLEVDSQKSYFIPPPFMKKVMHGDRVVAIVQTDKDREIADPEALVEPFLSRFVGKILEKNGRLAIAPDHPLLKEAIPCRAARDCNHDFKSGDWAVAEMRRHPLRGDRGFHAELTEYITGANDPLAPWWVTLSRHNLEREAPADAPVGIIDETTQREDLTALDFITIDSASTVDMDDALHVAETSSGELQLTVAIADPTAWIAANSKLDSIAAGRAFTNYLPGFNIPMLPRQLSDDLCSLRPYERRPVLACRVIVAEDGSLGNDVQFFSAWIESKAKLAYDDVSDWLENSGSWQPPGTAIANQLRLLHRISHARSKWRENHALIFKDRPDYRFQLDEAGAVMNIVAEHRRSANRMVEEAMIVANICAGTVLRDQMGYGVYNVHLGFDCANAEQASAVLAKHGIVADPRAITTLEGFRALRKEIDQQPTQFLDSRIRRFQSFAEITSEPGPHFGLGLQAYATWTSPIRKYGDMLNHRLIKAMINGQQGQRPDAAVLQKISERRRLNRMAERDVSDWLYARYLQPSAGTDTRFSAEIIDVSRGGIRVRLLENGAVAFIPASFLHAVRDELICSQEAGTVAIKGEIIWRVSDLVDVTIAEVRLENRSVIAKPVA